jgi:HK97 family phage portal protein
MAVIELIHGLERKAGMKRGQTTWRSVVQRPSYDNIWKLTNEGYRKNIIASACVMMLATSAAEAPLKIYRQMQDGAEEEIMDHWLALALKKPNMVHSAYEFIEWTVTFLNTGGASYWLKIRDPATGQIGAFYPLRPDRIVLHQGVQGEILGYEYRPEGVADPIYYGSDEVMRIILPDPLDPSRGLPPLARIAGEIGIDNEATDFTATFFKNAAVPLGLIYTDQYVDEEDAEATRSRWKRWFSGARRFLPAIFGQGMQYQQLSLDFQQMEFEKVRNMTETRICAAFGVDPVLISSYVGMKEGGKYSSYAEARAHLWDETIIPMLRRIESKINADLLANEENIVARFDLSQVRALQEDENEKWTRVVTAWEKNLIPRKMAFSMLGLPDPKGDEGDQYYQDTVRGMLPGPFGQPQEEQKKGLEIKADPPPEKSASEEVAVAALIAAVLLAQDRSAERLQDKIAGYFNQLQKDILALTYPENIDLDKLLHSIESKINEDQLGQTMWAELLAALAAGGMIGGHYMGRDFDLSHPDVDLQLQHQVDNLKRNVNQTTLDWLRKVIENAKESGWSIPRIREEIRSIFNGFSLNRTKVIAITEGVRALNTGLMIAYQLAGIQKMRWHAVLDDRTCPFCKKKHGDIVTIGEPFAELGEEIEGENEDGEPVTMKNEYAPVLVPPLHPRCRCILLPVGGDKQ